MADKPHWTPEQVIEALNACNGLIFLAAERLGCSSQTICNYQNRYASVRKAVLEKRGKRLDVGEAALDRAVLAGESWAVQFLLRTQGKDRGYVERLEVEGNLITRLVEEIVEADGATPDHHGNGQVAPGAAGIPS